jgi:hypothetical protein
MRGREEVPLARRETDTDGCLLSTDGIEPWKFNRDRCGDCKCLFQQTQTPCEQGAWVFPLLSCRGERRLCGGVSKAQRVRPYLR